MKVRTIEIVFAEYTMDPVDPRVLLKQAARSGDRATLERARAAGATDAVAAIKCAALHGQLATCKYIIAHWLGPVDMSRTDESPRDMSMSIAMHIARRGARGGHRDICELAHEWNNRTLIRLACDAHCARWEVILARNEMCIYAPMIEGAARGARDDLITLALAWARKDLHLSVWPDVLRALALIGDVSRLSHLLNDHARMTREISIDFAHDVVFLAARSGNLQMFDKAREFCALDPIDWELVFAAAAERGTPAFMRAVRAAALGDARIEYFDRALTRACEYGNEDVAELLHEWIVTERPDFVSSFGLTTAPLSKRESLCRATFGWCHPADREFALDLALQSAARSGSLEMCQLIRALDPTHVFAGSEMLIGAAKKRNEALCKLAHECQPCADDSATLLEVAHERGGAKNLEWLAREWQQE